MKHEHQNTDQHTALATLPTSFTPIKSPPGWTPADDLPAYLAERDEGVPVLPANASLAEAYVHVFERLTNATNEFRVALAVRAAFNERRRDPAHVRVLLSRPAQELVEHLRVVEIAQAGSAKENPDWAVEIRSYVNGQLDEAAFLIGEHERFLALHSRRPGSVSLWQLLELVYRLGGLACEMVEFCWTNKEFERLFEAVATPMRAEGYRFLHTAPERGCQVFTVWRRRSPVDGGEFSSLAA